MIFTIAYIEHNEEVYNKYLKPSLEKLVGDYDIISISDKLYPARNYNKLIDMSKNDWIVLTHQDVSFPADLLQSIEKTIKEIGEENIGALSMVGVNELAEYKWSNKDNIYKIQTSDCSFIVINKKNNIYFDYINFDEYHLYVEDYCIRINRRLNKDIFTIKIDSEETMDNKWDENYSFDKLRHHSYTCSRRGFCWGRYYEYKNKLLEIWGDVKTT